MQPLMLKDEFVKFVQDEAGIKADKQACSEQIEGLYGMYASLHETFGGTGTLRVEKIMGRFALAFGD